MLTYIIFGFNDYLNIYNNTCELIENDIPIYHNIFYKLFVFLSIISIGIYGSLIIVSKMLFLPMKIDFDKYYKENVDIYDYDPFLFEYIDEFYESDTPKNDTEYLNSLKNKYLKYNIISNNTNIYNQTDLSNTTIIMNYNHSNESFDYYYNHPIKLPFQYLDVISRIYVLKYNCKQIYVDNLDNLYNKNSLFKNSNSNSNSNSVFYNKITNNPVVQYNSNKYKYSGKLNDFVNKFNKHKSNKDVNYDYNIFINNLKELFVFNNDLQNIDHTDSDSGHDTESESHLENMNNKKYIDFKTYKNIIN